MTSESIAYAWSDSDVPARPQFCAFLYTACCAEVALLISLHKQWSQSAGIVFTSIPAAQLHILLSNSSSNLPLPWQACYGIAWDSKERLAKLRA